MKLLVIGCGGVATVAIHKCCANPVFTEICIASRTKSKCDALAEKLRPTTNAVLTTAKVDADSVESMSLEVDFTYWTGDAEQKRYLRYEFGPEDFFEENGALYICRKLQAEEGWEWFNGVRNEPRFIELTEKAKNI